MSTAKADAGYGLVASASEGLDFIVKEALNNSEAERDKIKAIPVKLRRVKDKRALVAAAGKARLDAPTDEIDLALDKFREMTDPYTKATRDAFTQVAFKDPVGSPALEKREAGFFKNGYFLRLVLKSPLDEQGNALTPEAEQAELAKISKKYLPHLKTIDAWTRKPTINLQRKMKTSLIAVVVQGRTLLLITPGIDKLAAGELPKSLRVVHTEDVGNPVVDLETWEIVALRLNNLAPKYLALPPEYVYVLRKEWGLLKDSGYYGASAFEAFLTISKILRKAYNYDMEKGKVAAYLTKLIILANVAGLTEAQRRARLKQIIADFSTHGTDIIAMEQGSQIMPSPVKVDTAMLTFVVNELKTLMLSAAGATKSQLGMTDGLTRDNATIQEISFVEYVRVPDEELVAQAIEDQLLNPLLAHLVKSGAKAPKPALEEGEPAGENQQVPSTTGEEAPAEDEPDVDESDDGEQEAGGESDELPVRIQIVAAEPKKKTKTAFDSEQPAKPGDPAEGDADEQAKDDLKDKKAGEIKDAEDQDPEEAMRQEGSKGKTFGAAGPSLQERDVAAKEKIADAVAGSLKGKGEAHVRVDDPA